MGDSVHVAWAVDEETGIAGGACDVDPDIAVRRAVGECAEHVSHVAAAAALPIGPGPGDHVGVDPRSLLPEADPHLSTWTTGLGMRGGGEVAVPAQAVLLGWNPPEPETRQWRQTSVGTAAGPSPDRASIAALAEVMERHTLIVGWRTGEIRFDDLGHLHAKLLPSDLSAALAAHKVELRSFRVAETEPEIVIALLSRAGGIALTCGAALRGDTASAVRHAVCEAIAVRLALSSTSQPGPLQQLHRRRGLSVAAAGPEHLRFVLGRVRGHGEERHRAVGGDDLVEVASSLFGHEPISVALPRIGGNAVQRVVCPGSAVFEPLTEPTGLTCPIA